MAEAPTSLDITRGASLTTSVERESSWTPQQMEFQLWLASPVREPKTHEEYAALHDLGVATLYRWKTLPGFSQAVTAMVKSYIRSDDVSRVLRAQVNLAASELPFASTQAAQLVLSAVGELPRAGGDVNVQVNNTVYDTGLTTLD